MKKLLLSLVALVCAAVGYADDVTTTFAGNAKGVNYTAGQTLNCAEGGLSWVTSGLPTGCEVANNARGIQFSKTSSNLTTTIQGATITKVVVVASSNTAENTIGCTVGGTAIGETQTINKSNNEEYTFTSTGASGEIAVVLTSPGESGKSIYVKSITVTYTGGNGDNTGGDNGDNTGGGDNKEEGDVFTAALTDGQGAWTIQDITLPSELTYIWQQSTQYGMKASAYKGQAFDAESYLISPVIALGNGSVLTFDHVQRNGANWTETETLWIREEGATTWAAQLTIPTYAPGTDWTYVSSGDIDLSAYAGKNVQLGWRYVSTSAASSTWELKNVKITNAKAAGDTPQLKDPTNTPETAYTATQAIEIINNKTEYDLSKEVYVKGTIKEIVSIDVTKYERAQYVITDGVNDFLIYNGYYLKGEKFTADDQIKVGDEVVVLGTITLYGEKYEMNANNKLYSINGVTEPVKPTITNPVLSVMSSYSDATGKSHNFLTEDGKLTVSVSCDTEGAVITYGLDSPDADEEYYTEPIVLTEGSHTLNVMATAGGAQSQVVSATYNVSKPCQFSDFANGDMEAWEEGVPAGWTTSSTASSENYEQTTDAHSGSYAVKVKGNNSSNQRMAFKEMFVKAGTYTLKAYAKDATGGATAAQATLGYVPFTLQDAGWYKVGSYQYISEKVVGEDGKTSTNIIYTDLSTSDWTEITGTVTIAEDCIASFLLMSKCKNVGSDVIFDDFSIELGEPTAITSVEATKKASAIYDLSGRRVEKASKGIFIIGGKKVVK